MKESLTSFDIRVLARELAVLQGAYLDKVYQEDRSFLFRFHVPGGGKPELFVEPGAWLFLGEGFERPPEPPPLARDLRAAVGNARVRDVHQKGFDRILVLELEKETDYALIFEMFAKGNLVLVREGRILHVLTRGEWRARTVKPGAEYRFPPAGVNPAALDRAEFRRVLREAQRPLVKALATTLSLGGLYAEEVCHRADLPKTRRTDALEEEELDAVYEGLRELLRRADDPSPALVRRDGEPVDAVPFPLAVHQGVTLEGYPTLSAALRAYVEAREEEGEDSPEVARIRRRIRHQEETLAQVEEEAAWAGAAADHLYARYQDVDRILQAAREGQRQEGVDPARGVVRVPVQGGEAELDYDVGVEENARRLYERKKELTERAERIREAREESGRELERALTEAQERGPSEPPAPSYAPQQKFWFDAYRWTLSSEGFLILAGRDARSNEKLVRKHLEAGDRYVHAELPGAPSVVVKDGAQAGEATLREACRFALIHSKAWRLGLGAGSAYWVTPEQVSKTAQSGEYLKTGAFVVRGTRNYAHNLELIMAVGEGEVEGTRRLLGGDPDAVRAQTERYVVLKPGGKGSRRDLVPFLSEAFRVPREDVERILPAGTFHVVEGKGVNLEAWSPG